MTAQRTASSRPARVADVAVGKRRSWSGAMLPGTIPLAHQEVEAVADLADMLRDRGLVLLSRPSVTVHHGPRPTMELAFFARPAADAERRCLAREDAQDEEAAS